MTSSLLFEVKDWTVRRAAFCVGPIDLGVKPGEIVTLMGPSGIGKTTLLMTWLGFETAELVVAGARRQHERSLAPGHVPTEALFIPQHLPFNPNWELESYLCRLPWGDTHLIDVIWPTRGRRRRRVREVLSQLGLAHRADATVAELSGSEAQRAALAQLLLLSPSLVIADEFVSSLDPGLAASLLDRCSSEIRRRHGAGIFAMHDVHAALRVSDRIMLLWPRSVEAQPWLFNVGTKAWHSDVLHAALCLAQWSKDGCASPSVSALVSLLDGLLHDEGRLAAFLATHVAAKAVLVRPSGVTPDDARPLPAIADALTGEWTQMLPLRVQANGTVSIGVAIPRGSGPSLTVLAETEPSP